LDCVQNYSPTAACVRDRGHPVPVSKKHSHMSTRTLGLERPEGKVQRFGVFEINISPLPSAETERHPQRRGPGNAGNRGPPGRKINISRAIKSFGQVVRSAPLVFRLFCYDELELALKLALVERVQRKSVRSSKG
jgi:hypothetical protein